MDTVAIHAIRLGLAAEPEGDAVEALDERPDPVLGDAVLPHDLGTGVAGGTGVGHMRLRRRSLRRRRGRDGVLAVAVDAKGNIDVAFRGLSAMDAALVFLEDEAVALAARRRVLRLQVGRAHALDVVDAVAIGADRREIEQALVVEGEAVDALAVFLEGGFRVDVVLHDDLHVLMTPGARDRDVAAIDHGLGIVERFDAVPAVAVPAAGHFGLVALQIGPAVDAVGIRGRGPSRRTATARPL